VGVLYTLLAAASFGFSNASLRRGVLTGTVVQAVAVSMPIGFVVFVGAAWVSGELWRISEISRASAALLAAAGIVHFLLGRYCNYRSIAAIGANLSTPAQQGTLLVSLVLAIIFLGERLTPLKIAGIALLVIAPALVFRRQVRKRGARAAVAPRSVGAAAAPRAKPDFSERMVEGYVYAFLASLAYGTSPVLVRAGLERSHLSLGGGAVSYGAAVVVVLALGLVPAVRHDVARLDGRGVFWFVVQGFAVCVSQMFLYMALALAPVTLVQPLMRFSPVFRTMFSWVLNRDHEDFSAGVMWAIGISLIGALALGLNTHYVIRILDAPGWLAATLAWTWP
jgi:drug/metabolite transporter (DMT)-like permease